MIRTLQITALAFLLCSTAALADASFAVNGAAAMEGSFGLEVTADGTPTNAFVRTDSPQEEQIYRASFLFDFNNMAMDGGAHLIVGSPATSPNGNRGFEVQITERGNGTHDVRGYAKLSAATLTRRPTPVITINDSGPHLIMVEWESASAPGVGDGIFRITVDGTTTVEASNVKTFGQGIKNLSMGFVGSSIDPATIGSHYFDDFQSFRTLAPAP